MQKKASFLLSFFIMLAIVLVGGYFWGQKYPEKITEKLHEYAPPVTSKTTQPPSSDAVMQKEQQEANKQPGKKTWYRDQVVVLMYHHISDEKERTYVLSPNEFESHMSFLAENQFNPISLAEFLRFVDTGVLVKENAVLITFDDGYESYYTEAWPILQKYGFPSTNFVIAGRLRDSVERKRENMITPLSLPQIQEMLATGLVSIGSHTYSLHDQKQKNEWGELTPDTAPVYLEDLNRLEEDQEYRNRLYVDFTMSRVALAGLDKKLPAILSLPFGFSNVTVTETAKEAGYKYVFTSRPDVVKKGVNRYEIPRYDVGIHEIDVAKLKELFAAVKSSF